MPIFGSIKFCASVFYFGTTEIVFHGLDLQVDLESSFTACDLQPGLGDQHRIDLDSTVFIISE